MVFGHELGKGGWVATLLLLCIPFRSFAQASLIDQSFAIGGGANGTISGIVVQDDERIIVGGDFTQLGGQSCSNLARVAHDGQVDKSFPQGTDGTVNRLLQQPDGRILAAGSFSSLQGVARQRLGRLFSNGTVDPSFDPATSIPVGWAALAIACQADGKVLASSQPGGSVGQARLLRFQSDGQPDPAFIQANLFQGGVIHGMFPLPNGSILVHGSFQRVNGTDQVGLALIRTNGEVDQKFSSPLSTNTYSGVYTAARLPDGGLLIGGRFWRPGATKPAGIAKLASSLEWDSAFKPDSFDPGADASSGRGFVMASLRQPDGKFVLAGLFAEVGGYWRRNVVRVGADGKVDPCFDPGIGLGDRGYFGGLALAGDVDGRILIGGNFVCWAGAPIARRASANITRLLSQTDCGVTRVHLGFEPSNQAFVFGSCAPGGTNYLQGSTNLLDWVDLVLPTELPAVSFLLPPAFELGDAVFFRVLKEF